ncbi:MAG: 2-C-methyl-D-erythritol 4-phosphate cytidylyltransferase [Bacteroidota bacterium]
MEFKERITAIIAAAGEGRRVGGELQKQFRFLLGKPILAHTLEKFQTCDAVSEIVLVVSDSMMAYSTQLVKEYRISKVVEVVGGGNRRQDSVYNGLQVLMVHPADIVLIHDAVRPLVSHRQIRELIEACITYKAAIPAIRPKDTVKQSSANGGFVSGTLDRSSLWLVQTPQAFAADLLVTAYQRAVAEQYSATDDASLVERMGVKVRIVEGNYENIKITTARDLSIAGAILKLQNGRVDR